MQTPMKAEGQDWAAFALVSFFRWVKWVHFGDAKLNRKVAPVEGVVASSVNLPLSLRAV